MSWVWVDEKPVWMGMGPGEEDVITSVKEYVEFERDAMMLEEYYTRGEKNVYASTTIPYSRK